MANRKRVPDDIEARVLTESRRRCCLCAFLDGDLAEKQIQIAHINRNRDDNRFENLAPLCLPHHDRYDSRTSQSKGLTKAELRHYCSMLYQSVADGSIFDVGTPGGERPNPDQRRRVVGEFAHTFSRARTAATSAESRHDGTASTELDRLDQIVRQMGIFAADLKTIAGHCLERLRAACSESEVSNHILGADAAFAQFEYGAREDTGGRLLRVRLAPGKIVRGAQSTELLAIVEAANVGSAPVTVIKLEFMFPNGKRVMPIAPESNVCLPHRLEDGDSCKLWISAADLALSAHDVGLVGETAVVAIVEDAVGSRFFSDPTLLDVDKFVET